MLSQRDTRHAWRRKYGDNAGERTRRVLTIRTSADGVTWTPEQDAGYSPDGPLHSIDALVTPDAGDPEALHFTCSVCFPTRTAMRE